MGARDSEPEELKKLQQMLGQALGQPSPVAPTGLTFMEKRPNLVHKRIESSSSISTMDAFSECGGEGTSRVEDMKKIMKVKSSGSVSTMVSDFNDNWESLLEEAGEVSPASGVEEALKTTFQSRTETPVAKRSTTSREDFSHGFVPKNHDFAEMYRNSAGEEPPTTLMIRNIPCRYSQRDLVMDLKTKGLEGVYDFLYMPMDQASSSSVGYAFVNFIHPSYAETCMQLFQGHRFKRARCARKVASVSVAHIQGLQKNLQHYEKTAVNNSKQALRRPMVIANLSGTME